jgi:hypothetical protein
MTDRWFSRAPLLVLVSLTASCTSLLGDFKSAEGTADGSTNDATTVDGQTSEGGGDLGKACASATDCTTGQSCTDGVCCESSCDGVCEKCNLPGSMGTCTAVPTGMDPDLECVMLAVPDAGDAVDAEADTTEAAAGDGGDAAVLTDAAVADAGDAGGIISDAAVSDAATITTPDGGLVADNTKCAGSCNGQRACQYPGTTTTCGAAFCGAPTETASLVCDGTGRCDSLGVTDCGAYACASGTGACATSCQTATDCAPTAFCNAQSQCQTKKGTGVECTNKNECSLGFCNDGYCCNSECSSIPGGRCDNPGSAGTCQCNLCDGGACEPFYADADHDGHGDPAVVKAGCSGAPPLGYVASNDDCDDTDKNTHPGQTAWFTSPRANGTFEYNCTTPVQEYPTYVGATCGFCSLTPTCGVNSNSCPSTTAQSYLNCRDGFRREICKAGFSCPVLETCTGTEFSTDGVYSYAQAFTATTACGAVGQFTYCGTCSADPGNPYSDVYSLTMPCH